MSLFLLSSGPGHSETFLLLAPSYLSTPSWLKVGGRVVVLVVGGPRDYCD